MSYILDALKKADAERGKSGSTATPGPAWAPQPKSALNRPIFVFGGLATLLLTAVVSVAAFYAWTHEDKAVSQVAVAEASAPSRPASLPEPPPTQAPPQPSAPPAAPAPVLQPAPISVPQRPAQAPANAESMVTPSAVVAAPSLPPVPAEAGAPGMPESPPSVAQGADGQTILKRVPLPPAPPALPAKVAPVPTRPAPTPAPAPKPAAAPAIASAGRSDIVVSGTSYSANPEHRMLIANGKVVKEGQELSPGLTLEAIGPRSAVFNQGGSRFNVNY